MIEDMGYHFAPPPRAAPLEPAALRALCFRRAHERYRGYVPRALRDAFLAELAAEVGASPEAVEETLWADRASNLLLRAGPAPVDGAARGDDRLSGAEPLQPALVIARYNAAAVATVLAASSWVTLSLPATETAALKDLYRHAKALHVGVEIALHPSAGGIDHPLAVTLYGPGSRALVRGRQVRAARAASGAMREGTGRAPGPEATETASPADSGGLVDDAPDPEAGDRGGASVPAPGGPPVAAIVARLARRHPRAIRDGWTRLLGPDGRLFHAPLDDVSLAALRDAVDDGVEGGEAETEHYDSAVEADFARAFHAAEAGGRLGVARGWTIQREPRAVVVDGTVFLPDFSFRRGDVEVLCEVVGYYTEDYLARKKRKLVHLRGRIPLLLVVDGDLAPLFSDAGFPLVQYKSGRQIGVPDVVQALDAAFDPFATRRAPGVRAFAALCAADGPRLTEEEVCAAVGCAGRTEVTSLWSDVLSEAAGGAGGAGGAIPSQVARPLRRRYVPGYGLAPDSALARARVALVQLLDDAEGAVPLEDALDCCAGAGLPEPDDELIAALGGVVVRAGLFREARVYRSGADADTAVAAALAPAPSGRRRQRRS